MAGDVPRLLESLNTVDVSKVLPDTVIPALTCIQGKPTGITQEGRCLYLTSSTADFYLVVDQPLLEGFSKALRAITMAIDVSGAKVTKRVAKLKGEKQVTEIEIRLQGEVKVEILNKEKKRSQKTYLRKGATPRKAPKVPIAQGSPPPTSNSWAQSSPELPVKPPTKVKKLTERPKYTAIAPLKRKTSDGPTNGTASAPAARQPLSAFSGIDQDLVSLAKKRKISVDVDGERNKTAPVSSSALAGTDGSVTANEGGFPSHASARTIEKAVLPAQAASKVPAVLESAHGSAAIAAPPHPTQPSMPVAPPSAKPTQPLPSKQSVNIVNGPGDASTSKAAVQQSTSANRQRMREKMEAKALANRALEEAEEERKLREAMSDIAVLEEGLTVGSTKYTPLKDITNAMPFNIIAVVADLRQAKQGSSLAQTFFVADPGVNKNAGIGDEMLITVFYKNDSEMPARQVGDVILLRGVKGQVWNGRVKLLGPGGQWSYATLDKNDAKIRLGPRASELHPKEIKHMRHMLAWSQATGLGASEPGANPIDATVSDRSVVLNAKRSQRLLKDVEPGIFFDSVAQVIHFNKLPPRDGFSEAELILTDGTMSPVYPPYLFSSVSHDLPLSAVFAITIWKMPEARIQSLFQPGAFVRVLNIRTKLYGDRLECVDHDSNLEAQAGYRKKERYIFVDPKSDEAKDIIARRAALEKGDYEQAEGHNVEDKDNRWAGNNEIKITPHQSKVLATHLKTLHDSQPLSSLMEIKENLTIPNKYRVHARVGNIFPRNNPKALVVKYCKKCRKRFKNTHCGQCGDDQLINAEYRYEIMIELVQDGVDAAVCALISHDEALKFLPQLRRLTAEADKADREPYHAGLKAVDALIGAASDGKRPHPVIDFTLQSYLAENHAVLQVFDMSK